jgi:hypothetical protein
MGDMYATAFKEGLKLSHVKKVNLADNRLNENGSFNLVKGLNKHVQEINLSNNKVGLLSIEHISSTLKVASETIDLRIIKFDNAGIVDSQVCMLIAWRLFSHARYASRRGMRWLLAEPVWWFCALGGAGKAISRRNPVTWAGYRKWLGLPG